MNMPKLPPELQPFIIPVCIIAGLLIIAMIRIVFLLRTNRRLMAQQEKMEQQVLNQQRDVIHVRQDSNAWRGALQVQFDAFRAESSRRLEDSEMRYDQATKQHESRIAEMQALLAKAVATRGTPPPADTLSPAALRPPNSVPRVPSTPAETSGSVLNDVVLP
ncbi:MAG: hypothetical protein JWO94_3149 [Verrucomicrobiaceae bacterium]|nr:hypothetical protein [Verrucomicrobiaceae bacterium]